MLLLQWQQQVQWWLQVPLQVEAVGQSQMRRKERCWQELQAKAALVQVLLLLLLPLLQHGEGHMKREHQLQGTVLQVELQHQNSLPTCS